MLQKYLKDLEKTARVQNKLDSHFEALVKQASAKVEVEQFLEKATVGELAKMAGITHVRWLWKPHGEARQYSPVLLRGYEKG
jgi:hypothetical protein